MGGSLAWMSIAVTSGAAFGTFFMAFHSTQGPQLGLPQMIQSRPQFGYLGALLVWIVALTAYIGFNAFNEILGAQTLKALFQFNDNLTLLVFAILAATLALVGYDLIHRAQRWTAYIMIGMLSIFTVGIFACGSVPRNEWELGQFKVVPFLAQFFAAASWQISWSIYVSDYSRYLPRDVGVSASFWWTYVGAFVGSAWMLLVGTISGSLYASTEVAEAMRLAADSIIPGFGRFLLFCSLLGLLTSTSLNFYGASLTLLSAIDSVRPNQITYRNRITTLVLSFTVATVIALTSTHDFMGRFGGFLAILLYLFTPWTAINLVDFYWVRRGHYSVREIFNPDGMYGHWNWRGLLSYVLGFLSMIPFFSVPGFFIGPIAAALGGADIAMLIGLPVAAVTYIWTCRSLDIKADCRRARIADVGLDVGMSPTPHLSQVPQIKSS
jgi:purine-cytosine permease-like protein